MVLSIQHNSICAKIHFNNKTSRNGKNFSQLKKQ